MDAQNSISSSSILEQLLQTTQEGFWFIDNDTVTLDVNPAMCSILARPREEIIGRKIFDFVDEENTQIFHRQISERRQGALGNYEVALRRPDGSNVPCINNATPVFDDDGTKVASIGLWTDISDIKRAETAMRLAHDELDQRVQERTTELARAYEGLSRSEAQLRLITDNVPALIAYVDRDFIIRFANKPFARYSKRSLDRIVGCHLRDVRGHQAYEESLPHSARALAGEIATNEGCRLSDDGELEYFRATRVPHFGDDGQVHGYFMIFLDMTEHEHREEQLRQAQKMQAVGQLTGGVAHDFNNLLTIIQGNLELISKKIEDPSVGRMAKSAIRASQRGAELTQRLLAYARRQPLLTASFDLRALVESMHDLLIRTLGERVQVTNVSADDLWPALADQGQVESALLNLAINARDAMPFGGRLTIECANLSLSASQAQNTNEAEAGDYVVLSVADTGTGMPPGVSEQAFEPFFTTKDVGEGSGLGLSMIYGFAKQSGGFVTIDSEEGSGTTVKLYLPRSHEAAPELVDEDSPEPRASEQKMILVIEDDPGVRELAVSMLESMGYRVHSVTDLTTAREALLSNGPPDLILSDVVLPGRASGPDIVAEIIESHPNVRTIFMSGYPAEIVGQETLLKVGASLINKPFSMNELEQAVREALV